MTTRQLICSVLGHIDHGKTTILDRIRGTAVQSREAGGITQHTGASEVPLEVIKRVCGPLLKGIKGDLKIPGLLFIDTPGHKAFTSLRQRGGSIADIAILVVDAQDILQPQALESIAILKQFKVPFIIALNKVDTIGGWVTQKNKYILDSIKLQKQEVQGMLEQRLYSLVNELSQQGINAERFDRISDFTKEVSIVPTSGFTGEGVPELLMVLSGLAQRYLEKSLEVNLDKPAVGSVLEVKEVKGLGTTLDVIIYDGTLNEGDLIVIGGLDKPIKSKARALLKPAPLQETREKGDYNYVKSVVAAAGVKISGPGLDAVVPGMPLIACRNEADLLAAEAKVQENINRISFKTDKEGIIIKADSLGSLEALTNLFGDYPVKKAVIGNVNKSDVIEAVSVKEKQEALGVIISFNVNVLPEAKELINENGIKLFDAKIIYTLLDDYKKHREEVELEVKRRALSGLVLPAKIKVLPDHVFRASGPAIIGVEVVGGTLKVGYSLINEELKQVGHVKSIRHDKEVLGEAVKGSSVAISIDSGVVGRNITEGGLLYTGVSEQEFHKMKTALKKFLKPDELEAMREILKLQREKNPLWGF
ncbi:MAG: translation initiation factor IF-2 [Candidatus Nanoarchaeia archaeon]|jgi:translation initiation factor 5B